MLNYQSPFFSIIVPVYNVAKYISECVDSILNQDYSSFEIILVDDGSTDASGKICDEYVKKDQRIKVIHQENKGLSEARNSGIKASVGNYLLFVDSDDYIAKNSLEKIYNIVKGKGIEVVFLEAIKFFPDGTTQPMNDGYVKEKIVNKSQEEVWEHIATINKFPGSACTKAIKRSLIIEENLFFVKGLISEDLEWCYRLFAKASKYSYLEECYYFYRQQREGSITNTGFTKGLDSTFWIIKKWATKKPRTKYQSVLNSFLSYQYMVALYSISRLNKNVSKKYFKEAKEYRWLLKYGGSKKLKLVKMVSMFLGIKNTANLLNYYKTYKKK